MKLQKSLQAPEDGQKTGNDAHHMLLIPAVKFAAATGGLGFIYGGTLGVLRDRTPVIAGIASSVHCAGIGAIFSLTRTTLLHTWNDPEAGPGTYTIASTLAGAFSGGSAGLLFRGPRSVLPGIICWSVFGASGQMVANAWTKPRVSDPARPGFFTRVSQSRWSPVSSMTDEQYAELLKEKLLRAEVEIAILDDKIKALKEEHQQQKAQAAKLESSVD